METRRGSHQFISKQRNPNCEIKIIRCGFLFIWIFIAHFDIGVGHKSISCCLQFFHVIYKLNPHQQEANLATGDWMRRVLHVGPTKTPGGMSTVINLLMKNPPEGWKTSSLATHISGNYYAKWRAWRRGRTELKQLLKQNPPDIVHIHSAADYSWWRKSRILKICHARGVPCVMHIHSGKFDSFCDNGKGHTVRNLIQNTKSTSVALSNEWAEKLKKWLPEIQSISNPIPKVESLVNHMSRDSNLLLLLGRADPVKGANLAIDAIEILRKSGLNVRLEMTAGPPDWNKNQEGIVIHGWVSEKKKVALLQKAKLLLIPSVFEGQPMVALEAMSHGLPILASPACSNLIENAGRIVEEYSTDAWAEEIKTLLNDEEAYAEMARRGPEMVSKHHPEIIASRWKAIYEELL